MKLEVAAALVRGYLVLLLIQHGSHICDATVLAFMSRFIIVVMVMVVVMVAVMVVVVPGGDGDGGDNDKK